MNLYTIITGLTVNILIRIKLLEGKVAKHQELKDDLQMLLNSLYDSGFLPEYLQEELSEREKSRGDYLDFPDFKNSQGNAESLNHPTWLSYQKEIFVPPESEYKNIIARKSVKSYHNLVPLASPSNVLLRQYWRSPFLDPQDLKAGLLAPLTDNLKNNVTANESLSFLLPIPEKGRVHETVGTTMTVLRNISSTNRLPQTKTHQGLLSSYNDYPLNYAQRSENTKLPQSSEKQFNDKVVYLHPIINSTQTSVQKSQFPHSINIETNIKSKPYSFQKNKLAQLEEEQGQATEVQDTKGISENSKKPSENKKKIYSFLKLFKKTKKNNELKTNNKNIILTPVPKTILKNSKPATLQELYDHLIDTRNVYETNNLLQSKIKENSEEQQKIQPEDRYIGPETDLLEESISQDLERSILNEAKIKMPQFLYHIK